MIQPAATCLVAKRNLSLPHHPLHVFLLQPTSHSMSPRGTIIIQSSTLICLSVVRAHHSRLVKRNHTGGAAVLDPCTLTQYPSHHIRTSSTLCSSHPTLLSWLHLLTSRSRDRQIHHISSSAVLCSPALQITTLHTSTLHPTPPLPPPLPPPPPFFLHL